MNNDKIFFQIKNLYQSIFNIIATQKKDMPKLPSPSQMLIIEYLEEHENEVVLQKDIENILKSKRATASTVIRTMERNGLIKRISSAEDARTKQIILTEKSRNARKIGNSKIDELDRVLKKGISEEELEVFNTVITKIINNAKDNTLP